MRALVTALGVIAAAGGVASANEYELGMGMGVRRMGSASVDALSADDRHLSTAVGGAIALPGFEVWGLGLEIDAGYEHAGVTGTTFQTIESDLSVHVIRVGARLRYAVSPRVSVYGRAGLDFHRARLELTDVSGSAVSLADDAHGGASSLGVGVDLGGRHRPGKRVTLGVRLSLDYTVGTGMTFDAQPAGGPGGANTIPVDAAQLGSVDISGWRAHIGAFARF